MLSYKMPTASHDGNGSVADVPPQDGRLIVKWIELQPDSSQTQYVYYNRS